MSVQTGIKLRGKVEGEVSACLSDSWCRNYSERATVGSPDIELLCISLRPFYLPREFGNIEESMKNYIRKR